MWLDSDVIVNEQLQIKKPVRRAGVRTATWA